MLWLKARQAEDEEVHSLSKDLQTDKLVTSDFEASNKKVSW